MEPIWRPLGAHLESEGHPKEPTWSPLAAQRAPKGPKGRPAGQAVRLGRLYKAHLGALSVEELLPVQADPKPPGRTFG